MEKKLKKIIIGSGSFLGKNIYEHFEKKTVSIESVSFRPESREDFRKKLSKILSSNKIETIYICGADLNYTDTHNVLFDLITSNIYLPSLICSLVKYISPDTNLIFFGSYWQFDAKNEKNPKNLYAATKSASEETIHHFCKEGVKACFLYLYDVYGPNDNRNKIFSIFKNLVHTKSKKIDLINGDQLIYPIHIKDVIRGCEKAETVLKKEFTHKLLKFNLNPNNQISVNDLKKIFEEISGIKLDSKINQNKKKSYKKVFNASHSLEPNLPGWQPKVSLNEGIKELLKN